MSDQWQPPDLRASDQDRDRVISWLRDAFAEGRLTQDEFEERMSKAQSSLTFGQLEVLVADLPAPLPAPHEREDLVERRRELRRGWYSWAGVSALVNVIWVATWLGGSPNYYWPIWVIGPWGAVMLIRSLSYKADTK